MIFLSKENRPPARMTLICVRSIQVLDMACTPTDSLHLYV